MSFVVAERRYGKHKGFVSNNNDPLKLGRIKVTVPSVYGKQESGEFLESPWALPSVPFAGEDEGMLCIPSVNSGVWVEFEEGDISRPIWVGCFWARPAAVTKVSTRTGSEVPARDDYPKNRIIETKMHRIELNDVTKELRIMSRTQDTDIAIKADGTVNIENEQHQLIMGGAETGSLFRYLHKVNNATIQVPEDGDIVIADANGSSILLTNEDNGITLTSVDRCSIEITDIVEINTNAGSNVQIADDRIQLVTPSGTSIVVDEADKQVSINADDINLLGGMVTLGDLPTQLQLLTSAFLTLYNNTMLLIATHVHVSASPGQPTSPSPMLAPLVVPVLPVAPHTTVQVTGG